MVGTLVRCGSYPYRRTSEPGCSPESSTTRGLGSNGTVSQALAVQFYNCPEKLNTAMSEINALPVARLLVAGCGELKNCLHVAQALAEKLSD